MQFKESTFSICIFDLELNLLCNLTKFSCIGSCIIAYWRYGTWLGAINCPICRQMVSNKCQNLFVSLPFCALCVISESYC